MKFKSLKLKYTYALCSIATLISVYMLSSNEDLGEAMRPDDYSMGTGYYILLFSAGIFSSVIIVLFTQWPEPIQIKFSILLKAILITTGIILIGGILFAIIFGIAMSGGHWAFG